MSASVKRTVLSLAAAIVMSALSTLLAVTLMRLVRQHQQVDDDDSTNGDAEPLDQPNSAEGAKS
jgi:hypothetical protein